MVKSIKRFIQVNLHNHEEIKAFPSEPLDYSQVSSYNNFVF